MTKAVTIALAGAVTILWVMSPQTVTAATSGVSATGFLHTRARYETNVLEAPSASGPKADSVANLWAGFRLSVDPDDTSRLTARYEAAPRRYGSYDRQNRHDHLASVTYRRRVASKLTVLAVGSAGLRVQPANAIHEYSKQAVSAQGLYRWDHAWTSSISTELRHKAFPNFSRGDYQSVMGSGRVVRRFGGLSSVGAEYQLRSYTGAIDPRVLVSDINRDMSGTRHAAGLWAEHMVGERVLARLAYRLEVDNAARALQAQERYRQEPEQDDNDGDHYDDDHYDDDGDDGDHYDDDVYADGDEHGEGEDVDFNFTNHRSSLTPVWRAPARATARLSARRHAKYFHDWVVRSTGSKRHDSLTLLRAAVSRPVGAYVSAQLEYAFRRNVSNDPAQEYAAHAYSAQIGLRF